MNFIVCKVYSCACIFFFSYRLDVHVFYDQSFFERFGEKSVTRIRHLLSIVKVIFSEPTLTTVIVPNVINISYYRERSWEASGKDLQYVELTTFSLLLRSSGANKPSLKIYENSFRRFFFFKTNKRAGWNKSKQGGIFLQNQ